MFILARYRKFADMDHGLLAPQFGLGRNTPPAPNTTERSITWDERATENSSPAAPTVVVKRRRVPENQGVSFAENSAPSIAARGPKVYRLQSPTEAPVHIAQASASTEDVPLNPATQTAVPLVSKVSRQRDPARRPTLLKHVVFELVREADAPISRLAPLEAGNTTGADFKFVRSALKALDAELQRTARAQAAYSALDAHLARLGVAGDPTAGSRALPKSA